MNDMAKGGCLIGFGVVCLLAGCPQEQTGSSTGTQQVSGGQAAAIEAAIQSIESLAGSLNTTQNATGGEGQASRTSSSSTCPEASFSADTTNGLALALTLDFGDGCAVLGSAGYTCSGSISGSFSQSDGAIDAQFGALTCNGYALEGSLSFTYDVTPTSINALGTWDITYSDDSSSVSTTGSGQASYDSTAAATTFASFEGDVTADDETYGVMLVNVITSFANNGNFIPQGGTLTLTGQRFDSIAVTFNATSPSTGDVTVRINGGPSFGYNLFDD